VGTHPHALLVEVATNQLRAIKKLLAMQKVIAQSCSVVFLVGSSVDSGPRQATDTYTYRQTGTQTHPPTHTHTYIYTYRQTGTQTHTHTHKHTHIHTHTNTHTHTSTHTHTHTHTQIRNCASTPSRTDPGRQGAYDWAAYGITGELDSYLRAVPDVSKKAALLALQDELDRLSQACEPRSAAATVDTSTGATQSQA
jgi:ABC-type Zn2+ transport system substrate-binding protein/surface adhesin